MVSGQLSITPNRHSGEKPRPPLCSRKENKESHVQEMMNLLQALWTSNSPAIVQRRAGEIKVLPSVNSFDCINYYN